MATGKVIAAFPLTSLQEGMLYESIRNPGSEIYQGQCTARLEGPLDVNRFRQAWRRAAARHEAFRTFFAWENRPTPLQVVRQDVDLEIPLVDWSGLTSAEQAKRWANRRVWRAADAIPMDRAPMMRFELVRLSETSHQLFWGVHHAVLDGWSGFSVLREVLEDYEALGRGGLAERAAVPSYAQFVGWLQGQDFSAAESYWRKTLRGFRQPTPLPVRSTGRQGSRRGNRALILTVEETEALEALARDLRVTMNTLMVGAWAMILARHSGQSEVVFGVTVSERPHVIDNIEQAAGLYLNTIPVRVEVPDQTRLSEWVRDLQIHLSRGRANSAPGLSAIQAWSEVQGRGLFDSLVVFESFPPSISTPRGNGTVTMHDALITGPSDLPLALQAFPSDTLEFHLVFDADRVTPDAAGALLDQVRELLGQMVPHARSAVGSVPWVAPPTRDTILESWSTTPSTSPDWPDVLDAYAAHVARHPDRVAVTAPDGEFTYRELDEASNIVALKVRATEPGALVGVAAERSRWYVAAVLGALRSKRTYVALDPEEPMEQRRAKLGRVVAVVTPNHHAEAFPDTETIPWPLGPRLAAGGRSRSPGAEIGGGEERAASDAGQREEGGTSAAYVIYTSGSTGRPKGVVVERSQLAYSNAVRRQVYGESPGVFLLLSPLTVDSAVAGFYWALSGGGTLVIPPARIEQDPSALSGLIGAHRVTHTLLVPSLYEALLDHLDASVLADLRTVVVAGEACRANLVGSHFRRVPHARLFNEYGPSEATVWCTVAELSESDPEVTIGRPIPGARIYLLDGDGEPVPAGMAGEIFIGGPGVARGYLSDAETTERFSENRFHGGRLYRTGDLATWTSEGEIVFLGRSDEQLKVRGHRIEPQEIERALDAHPAVQASAVALVSGAPGGREGLVAFVVPEADEPPESSDLAAHLADRLPPVMVPRAFRFLPGLPRTSAGKLDRRALAAIEIARPPSVDPAAVGPRDPVEEALAEIWREVLGLEHVGVEDDFFALGGDSLLSIRVLARAGLAGYEIRPEAFFERPTIAHLARGLAEAGEAQSEGIEQGPVTGPAPLTPIQHWFVERITDGRDRWNQCWMLELPPGLTAEQVERAVRALIEHHDALRARLVMERSEVWRQEFDPIGDDVPFRIVDVGAADDGTLSTRELEAEQQAMKLQEGPLFRCVLFRRSEGRDQLILLAHHAVVDGISWAIMLEDLSALLAPSERRAPKLPPKTTSALEWAHRLEGEAERLAGTAAIEHWLSQPEGSELRVPCDIQEEARRNRVADGAVTELTVDAATTDRLLREQPRELDTSTQELLLAGLLMAWKAWTGRSQLLLDTEGHGRDLLAGVDVSRTVGWFTTTFPIWAELERSSPIPALLAAKAALTAAEGSSHGLLRFLAPDEKVRNALARKQRPELLFNYLSSTDSVLPSRSRLTAAIPPPAPLRSLDAPRAYPLEINARVERGRLTIVIEHSKRLLRPQSIRRFVDAWERCLHELALAERDPFAMSGLDADQLDIVGDLLSEVDDE